MSKAELEVVLASPGPFVPGDVVEGFVGVTVNKSCRCRELRVLLEWYTHGRGNKRTGVAVSSVLFEGDMVAGNKGLHPFSMTVPPGPFSYSGTYVSVGWRVRATADLPWAFDPKTEVLLKVIPGTAPLDSVDHGPESRSLERLTQARDTLSVLVGIMFMIIPGFMALCVFGMFGLSIKGGASIDSLIPLVCGVSIPAIFIYFGFRIVRPATQRLIGARRLSEFELTAPTTIRPGEAAEVKVLVTPRADLDVQAIRVELVLRETAVSGSGTKKTTHSHVQTVASVVLDQPGTLLQRRPTTFAGTLPVPDTLGPTFGAQSNSVAYSFKAIVDCPGPFDAEHQAYVTVVPANLTRDR